MKELELAVPAPFMIVMKSSINISTDGDAVR